MLLMANKSKHFLDKTDYSVGIDNQLQSRGKSIQTINMGQTHLHTEITNMTLSNLKD